MRNQPIIIIFILLLFILLTDLYTHRGLTQIAQNFSTRQRILVLNGFWLITAIILIWLLWLVFSYKGFEYERFYHNVTIFFGVMVLFYVPKLFFNIFLFFNDIADIIKSLITGNSSYKLSSDAINISRADFLLRLGLILSAIPFISILWGIWKGKYNFTVERLVLHFPNLPGAFHGTRILQISDFHIGSFYGNPQQVERAVELINAEDADYILFTGDIVNNKATELEEFMTVLSELKARKGKYSILGNHDYGDYYQWGSKEEQQLNMEHLYTLHEKMGFRLLRNESVQLLEENQELALIGVENWGLPPFPQYGDLEKAMRKVKDTHFKILMSHDPSHWDAEVLGKKDIDLTLSGHTHGMQFAIRIPGWRWSPVSMKYRRWGGLYTEGRQKLYVNIGIGFIGFPGRVGTPPEITVIELRRMD